MIYYYRNVSRCFALGNKKIVKRKRCANPRSGGGHQKPPVKVINVFRTDAVMSQPRKGDPSPQSDWVESGIKPVRCYASAANLSHAAQFSDDTEQKNREPTDLNGSGPRSQQH
jgi:hypothetical protein